MAEDPVAIAKRKAQELAKLAHSNGNEDPNRKRGFDDSGGSEGPDSKKPAVDIPTSIQNAQAIAKAAVSKLSAEFGFQQNISMEIKIPNRMVGLVIGRGGEMITKLQAEAGAKIQVAPDGTEINGERQVSISGSPECVEKAKILVNDVIENAGGATNVSTPIVNLQPGQEVVELMIPATKVGLIIGKGGEMIKMLQERAGCKMQMIQDGPYADTPEKPLRMTGFAENCKKARQLVLELLETKELEARGLLEPDLAQGAPTTIEMQIPKEFVGYVIGKSGEHIVNIQSSCNVRMQFQNELPGPMRGAIISGAPMNCQKAKAMVEQMVAERSGGNAAAQTMGMGGKQRIELPNPAGPGVTTIQVPVPSNKCGLIIGKGGDTIRQLMVQSGAYIALDMKSPDPNEKLFNVKGTTQQIQLAQQLITAKIDGNSYPGQGTPYGYPAAGVGYQQPMGGAGNPYGQYNYGGQPGGYGANPQQDQAQAWNAYYQWAAQAQQQQQQQQPQQQPPPQQQPGGAGAGQGQQYPPQQQGQAPRPGTQPAPNGGNPPAGGGASAGGQSIDLQAQWAEYYKQLGYYYQQQPGAAGGGGPPAGGGPQGGPPPAEQK